MSEQLLSPEDTAKYERIVEKYYEIAAKAEGPFEIPQIAFNLGRTVGYLEATLKMSENFWKFKDELL